MSFGCQKEGGKRTRQRGGSWKEIRRIGRKREDATVSGRKTVEAEVGVGGWTSPTPSFQLERENRGEGQTRCIEQESLYQ